MASLDVSISPSSQTTTVGTTKTFTLSWDEVQGIDTWELTTASTSAYITVSHSSQVSGTSATISVTPLSTATLGTSYSFTIRVSGGTTATGIYSGSASGSIKAVKYISTPTVDGVSKTYTGSTQGPSITRDTAGTSISGTTTAKDAGDYNFVISLNSGYLWTGGSSESKSYDWSIAALSISDAQVTLGTSLTYTGQEQTQTVTKVTTTSGAAGLSATYTVSGNTGTNAGSYTLTCTGNGNFKDSVTATWTIAQATGWISWTPTQTSFSKTYSPSLQWVSFSEASGSDTISYGKVTSESSSYLSVDSTYKTIDIAAATLPSETAYTIKITAKTNGTGNYTSVTTTRSFNVTINKATASVTTAPTMKIAATGTYYNGAYQDVWNAGTAASGCEIKYHIDKFENGAWSSYSTSTTIQQIFSAGSYRLSYQPVAKSDQTTYIADGSVVYLDSGTSFTVSAVTASITTAPTAYSGNYDGAAHNLISSVGTPGDFSAIEFSTDQTNWYASTDTGSLGTLTCGTQTVYYRAIRAAGQSSANVINSTTIESVTAETIAIDPPWTIDDASMVLEGTITWSINNANGVTFTWSVPTEWQSYLTATPTASTDSATISYSKPTGSEYKHGDCNFIIEGGAVANKYKTKTVTPKLTVNKKTPTISVSSTSAPLIIGQSKTITISGSNSGSFSIEDSVGGISAVVSDNVVTATASGQAGTTEFYIHANENDEYYESTRASETETVNNDRHITGYTLATPTTVISAANKEVDEIQTITSTITFPGADSIYSYDSATNTSNIGVTPSGNRTVGAITFNSSSNVLTCTANNVSWQTAGTRQLYIKQSNIVVKKGSYTFPAYSINQSSAPIKTIEISRKTPTWTVNATATVDTAGSVTLPISDMQSGITLSASYPSGLSCSINSDQPSITITSEKSGDAYVTGSISITLESARTDVFKKKETTIIVNVSSRSMDEVWEFRYANNGQTIVDGVGIKNAKGTVKECRVAKSTGMVVSDNSNCRLSSVTSSETTIASISQDGFAFTLTHSSENSGASRIKATIVDDANYYSPTTIITYAITYPEATWTEITPTSGSYTIANTTTNEIISFTLDCSQSISLTLGTATRSGSVTSSELGAISAALDTTVAQKVNLTFICSNENLTTDENRWRPACIDSGDLTFLCPVTGTITITDGEESYSYQYTVTYNTTKTLSIYKNPDPGSTQYDWTIASVHSSSATEPNTIYGNEPITIEESGNYRPATSRQLIQYQRTTYASAASKGIAGDWTNCTFDASSKFHAVSPDSFYKCEYKFRAYCTETLQYYQYSSENSTTITSWPHKNRGLNSTPASGSSITVNLGSSYSIAVSGVISNDTISVTNSDRTSTYTGVTAAWDTDKTHLIITHTTGSLNDEFIVTVAFDETDTYEEGLLRWTGKLDRQSPGWTFASLTSSIDAGGTAYGEVTGIPTSESTPAGDFEVGDFTITGSGLTITNKVLNGGTLTFDCINTSGITTDSLAVTVSVESASVTNYGSQQAQTKSVTINKKSDNYTLTAASANVGISSTGTFSTTATLSAAPKASGTGATETISATGQADGTITRSRSGTTISVEGSGLTNSTNAGKTITLGITTADNFYKSYSTSTTFKLLGYNSGSISSTISVPENEYTIYELPNNIYGDATSVTITSGGSGLTAQIDSTNPRKIKFIGGNLGETGSSTTFNVTINVSGISSYQAGTWTGQVRVAVYRNLKVYSSGWKIAIPYYYDSSSTNPWKRCQAYVWDGSQWFPISS